MITADFVGGLGNRMFQYSVLLAASRSTGHAFAPPDWPDGERIFAGLRPASRTGAPIARAHREERCQAFNPSALAVKDGTRLVGYFQTDRYLRGIESEVREVFRPRDDVASAVAARIGNLRRPILAVHVRGGDYLPLGWERDGEWYRRAISMARSMCSPASMIVLTNDHKYARFCGLQPEATADMAVDLFTLVAADAVVMSASSFSWWGGWLGRPGRAVVAPHHWLGGKGSTVSGCTGWFPAHIAVEGWRFV